jgi:hypothetical protein
MASWGRARIAGWASHIAIHAITRIKIEAANDWEVKQVVFKDGPAGLPAWSIFAASL